MTPRRVAVVGPVASGKSTLAAAVQAHTGLPHLDLDELFWEPGWTPAPPELFQSRLADALSADEWIADGNYGGQAAELLTARAELVIWMDMPLRVCLPRLLIRSVKRAASGEKLFAGNTETFRHLLGPDSIIWWGTVHHGRHGRRWRDYLSAAQESGTDILQLTRPAHVDDDLRKLGMLGPAEAPCAR